MALQSDALACVAISLCALGAVGCVAAFPYTFSYMRPAYDQQEAREQHIQYDHAAAEAKDEVAAPASSSSSSSSSGATFPPTNNFPAPAAASDTITNKSDNFPAGTPADQTQPSSTPDPPPPFAGPVNNAGTGGGPGQQQHDLTSSSSSSSSSSAAAAAAAGGGGGGGGGKVWCIAKPSVDEITLMGNMVYACGEGGGVNCASIQPGGACFKPNSLTAHASFIMNLYYQRNQRNWWTCHFNDTGLVVFTDPSYGECIYPPQ